MILNGPHRFLSYADDVNILCGSVHTIKKDTESLEVGSKEMGIEVNADKTKCMVTSRDQNAGRSHNMKIDNSSFESVEQFKCLGTTLTYQNTIQEEIKNYLRRSQTICRLRQILFGDKIENDKMGLACSMHGREERSFQAFWWGNLR